jgi:anti-anti-sigma factor
MSVSKIQDELIKKSVFLNIKGQLNPHNALSFKKNIFNIPEDKRFLVLDLSNLNSISGEGIKVFFESIKYFKKRDGIVILIQPKEEIFLLLKFLKLLNYVIVVESYQRAKEVIEEYLQHQGLNQNLQIEELVYSDVFKDQLQTNDLQEKSILANNISYYQKIAKTKENPTKEELEHLKESLQIVHNRLQHLSEKIDKQNDRPVSLDQEIIQLIENKILEIKKSNEFYFSEFQTRLNVLEESNQEIKEAIKEIKNTLNLQPKPESPIKKIDGYFIVACQSCGQPLRVKQLGRHICPNCKAEFNVLPKGEVKFYEHS